MRRDLRLRKNQDFQRVRRVGKSYANPLLVLWQAPNPEGKSRYGFAVGKKVGGAVQRNRIKRRLRERIRLHLREERLRSGVDVVVIARVPAAGASFQTLVSALDELLQRGGIWRRQEI